DRPDIARKRARWKAYQGRIDPKRLVFIDETWAKMAPLRGWGLRGKRLKTKAPYGHWKTMTFLAALRHDRIDAPWVVDGPINGELFRLQDGIACGEQSRHCAIETGNPPTGGHRLLGKAGTEPAR